uniref:GTP-binding protein P alpha subunit gpa1 n=1 Tax=Rhizophora mucronata TaxID=61149 RepID=A0A2P2KR38_RHIMU
MPGVMSYKFQIVCTISWKIYKDCQTQIISQPRRMFYMQEFVQLVL